MLGAWGGDRPLRIHFLLLGLISSIVGECQSFEIQFSCEGEFFSFVNNNHHQNMGMVTVSETVNGSAVFSEHGQATGSKNSSSTLLGQNKRFQNITSGKY